MRFPPNMHRGEPRRRRRREELRGRRDEERGRDEERRRGEESRRTGPPHCERLRASSLEALSNDMATEAKPEANRRTLFNKTVGVKFLQIFGGLVLGCIETKFCKK